jgi:hypothetical protein
MLAPADSEPIRESSKSSPGAPEKSRTPNTQIRSLAVYVGLVILWPKNFQRTFCPRIAQKGQAFGQSSRLVQAQRAAFVTTTNPETLGFIEHSMVGATGIEPVTPTMST